MNQYLEKYKEQFEKTFTFLRDELAKMRTGRASPSLVENLAVEAYDSKMPLQQLATITTPEPKQILIQPWDRSIIKNIETAIRKSDINLNPVVVGENIRINLPPMTEENRKQLVKLLGQKLEQAKQSARTVRDKVREEIIDDERAKKISEDDKYRFQKELDEYIQQLNDRMKKIGERKEEEIMKV